jgi:hypothetical protein
VRLLPLLLLLAACDSTDECVITEGTGIFELFKTEGCFATDVSVRPADGALLSVFHKGNVVLDNGVDTFDLGLSGRLYVGRRGSCSLSDSDVNVGITGHCDYFIRDYTDVSETESRFTVELVDVYGEAYGNKGTLKGVLTVTSTDQGFGP